MSENMIGRSAEYPIRLWDRLSICNYLDQRFGDDYFINGESLVKTNDGKEVKLVQIKDDKSNKYINIYFGLL